MLNIDTLLTSQLNNISRQLQVQSNCYNQLFALYYKAIRYHSIMLDEIFTYTFDLAYQTSLEYGFLVREINEFTFKYILSTTYDKNEFQEYLNKLCDIHPLNNINYHVIDKYLDDLLYKELDSLHYEQADLIRKWYKNSGHDILVTKRNYDSIDMCVGILVDARDMSRRSYRILDSMHYFDHKYFGFKKHFNYNLRLLTTYEIVNAVKYDKINYNHDIADLMISEIYDLNMVKRKGIC